MTLITDPDDLTQETEVTIDEATRKITLNITGNLSTDGVTMQCLYSFLKEEWKSDASLIPYPFPMLLITPEKGEWLDNWELYDDASRKLIRNGGWREYDSLDVLKEEWCGVISLDIGALTIDGGDTAYYLFSSLSTKADFTYDGKLNESIQTYGDTEHGDFDYRNDILTVFLREQGKLYAQSTSADIGYSLDDYSVGRYPLGEGTDLNITATDNDIETQTPYTNMGIEFFTTPQPKDIGGSSYDFGLIILSATGTVTQIYEYLQYQLRQNSDIDDGTGTHLGTLTDTFSVFIGTRLDTLSVINSEGGGTGIFLDNVATADTNKFRLIDNTGAYREYPFVSTGRINFNAYLTADANGIYRMYFTYTEGYNIPDLGISSSAGVSASLDSTGGNLPTLSQNDYIYISGMTNPENNGLWKITDASPTSNQMDADKYDGIEPSDESETAALIGENPYGTPSAVIVDDNSDTDIAGDISSAEYIDFDFDYDGNAQGGRTPAEDVMTTIVGIGHNSAQFVVATLTIERKIGNNVTLVASLERNFSNPT